MIPRCSFYNRGLFPTISLLCRDIQKSSKQLHFLYESDSSYPSIENQCFEASAYLNNVKRGKLSTRHTLTKREEARLIGAQSRAPCLPPRFVPDQELPPYQVSVKDVESFQMQLNQFSARKYLFRKCKKEKSVRTFPLDAVPSSKLETDMMKELKDSWDAHQDIVSSQMNRNLDVNDLSLAFDDMRKRVSKLRLETEQYALDALSKKSYDRCHWYSNAHKLMQIAGLFPLATVVDLARIALDPGLVSEFNPMLSEESRSKLIDSITVWLQLCVYEDKLARMLSLCAVGASDEVIKEIETKPSWNASDHPYWLVFEVENRIMIRQEQHKVADHLISNPGDVIQLNMGLGKVRSQVILTRYCRRLESLYQC